MIAVPQSGPMTSSPLALALRFSAISSSSVTWSLNRNTCRPRSSASSATPAAKRPGMEINTHSAPAN